MQRLAKQTIGMIKIEAAADMRKPVVLAAAGLQILSVALLCYLSNPLITGKLWNSLFWLSIVFTTLQAVSKSFVGVSRARWIYLNQLASPAAIILAKILYGWVIMLGLSMINLVIFILFMGYPIEHSMVYFGFVLLTAGGLGTVFTMISGIASKTTHPGVLVPVMSLPVIFPVILIGVQGSVKCLNPVLVSSAYKDLILLGSMNLLVFVLAAVLFNPLWKE